MGFNKFIQLNKISQRPYFPYFLLGLILLVTVACFYKSIFFEFVNWDDNLLIYENYFVTNFSKVGFAVFAHSLKHLFYSDPLTLFSHALTYRFFGANPMPYHLINILLHLANVALVFLLIKQLTQKVYPALFVTLIFAIHPLRIESVVWASERKDVLYAFFFLLSLISYLKYIHKTEQKYALFALVFFTLSVFAKAAGIVLPFVLFAIDYYKNRKFSRETFREKIPFLMITFLMIFTIIYYQKSENKGIDSEGFQTVILYAAFTFVYYVRSFFYPFPATYFDMYPHGSLPHEYYVSLILCFVIISLIGFTIYKFKSVRKELIFGFAFFLINISLVLHIAPMKGIVITAERYTYMAHLGLSFMVVILAMKLVSENLWMKLSTIAAFSVILMLFSFITFKRIDIWKNRLNLFNYAVSVDPNNGFVLLKRGIVHHYYKDDKRAMTDFNKACELRPDKAFIYSNRGDLKLNTHDYEGAILDFTFCINKDSSDNFSLRSRGLAYFKCNRKISACADWISATKNGDAESLQYIRKYFK